MIRTLFKCCLCLSLVIKISSSEINLFLNYFLSLKLIFRYSYYLLSEIKTCLNLVISECNFSFNKSDLFITNIAFSFNKSFKKPLKSIFLASTTTSFKSAFSAFLSDNLIPFFSISSFDSLIPAVSDIITG